MSPLLDDEPSQAFGPSHRPAWTVLLLVGSILAGAAGVIAVDHRLAIAAAQDVVAPVEKRLDDHLSSARAMREVMDRYVAEERQSRRALTKKIDALCRANPRADCPLGDE